MTLATLEPILRGAFAVIGLLAVLYVIVVLYVIGRAMLGRGR